MSSIFKVTDPDKEQFFFICLDDKVRLDDETAANLALQCRLRTI